MAPTALIRPACLNPRQTARGVLRPAIPADLDAIYALGQDVWGEGMEPTEYRNLCRHSIKYLTGQWYVLVLADGDLVNAVITYELPLQAGKTTLGVGSVATTSGQRNRGLAGEALDTLLSGYTEQFEIEQFVLFSDAHQHLYESKGFVPLPPSLQAYEHSVCMLRASASRRAQILQSMQTHPVRRF